MESGPRRPSPLNAERGAVPSSSGPSNADQPAHPGSLMQDADQVRADGPVPAPAPLAEPVAAWGSMPDDTALGGESPASPRFWLLPGYGCPVLAVITGPSGVGKDSVVNRLKELGRPYRFVVTATTRPPRVEERHGIDYFFIQRAEYDRMLAEDEFLEHALVYGHGYGIPRAQVREALASGRDVVVRIDPQGAATIGRLVPGAVRIFLAPDSIDELGTRLRIRGTETPEAIARRLALARTELERVEESDYLVVNRAGRLDETVAAIDRIIHAERCRVHRTPITV